MSSIGLSALEHSQVLTRHGTALAGNVGRHSRKQQRHYRGWWAGHINQNAEINTCSRRSSCAPPIAIRRPQKGIFSSSTAAFVGSGPVPVRACVCGHWTRSFSLSFDRRAELIMRRAVKENTKSRRGEKS